MGYKCCVPNCNSNYKGGPKITVFRFPKKDDLTKKKWMSGIPRENFIPTKNSRVSLQKHYFLYIGQNEV